jgi:Ca2+-binding EF-hand superfamily protein
MTISATYTQGISLAISYSASAVANTAPAQTSAPAQASTQSDSADLSPEAQAAAASASTTDSSATTASGTTASGTTTGTDSPSRTDALMSALDANGDGSISAQEFTSGAESLLHRAGGHHRHHHHEGGQGQDGSSGPSRLDQKLDQLFKQLDTNGDGSVSAAELASALGDSSSSGVTPDSSQQSPAPAAAAATMQVTVVAVAVRQYTVTAQSGDSGSPTFTAAA